MSDNDLRQMIRDAESNWASWLNPIEARAERSRGEIMDLQHRISELESKLRQITWRMP